MMNELKKQQLTTSFFDELQKISELKNPLEISKGFLRLETVLNKSFEECYSLGLDEGIKIWSKQLPSN